MRWCACACACVCKDMGHRSGYPAEVGRHRWRTGRGRAYHGRQTNKTGAQDFSRVSTTAAAASMGEDTTQQLGGTRLVAAEQMRISVLEIWILQQSEAAVAGRGKGGRGQSRVGKARSGGMMSLALHARLHWGLSTQKCCLSKVQSFARRPVVLGEGGRHSGDSFVRQPMAELQNLIARGRLGASWASMWRELCLPGMLCHRDRSAQTAR